MSCPTPTELSSFYTIDASAIEFVNQLWNQIITNLQTRASTRAFAEYLRVFVIGCKSKCDKIQVCKPSICEMIAAINQTAPQSNYGFNFNVQLRPILFAFTRKNTFVPLADGVYGGLYANPIQYQGINIRQIYERIILNPLGSFSLFDANFKYIDAEEPDNLKLCPAPARGYFRIVPVCTKKYKAIVLGVWYLLYSGIQIQTNPS